MPGFMITILVLVSIFMYNGCNAKKDTDTNVVAEFDNGRKITFDELKQYAFDNLYNKRYRVKSEAYRHALNDMLLNQMKRVDFFESHLDTNKALIQSINRIINESLVSNYFQKEYLDKYTNEEFAKKIYNIMDKRVVYQEIVLNKPRRATKSELAKIEKKALDIKTQIENGADFNTLVQKYSQDKQSVQSNGYPPPVAWQQSIEDPVGNVIFNLKENDIRVLSTNNDYRIVRVTEINKVHLEPFEKIKDKIIDQIKRIYTQRSADEYNKDKDALIDTTNLSWNEAALKQIVQWSNIPNFYQNGYEDTLTKAISGSNNKIILTYRDATNSGKNGKVDYKEYLRLLKNILLLNPRRKVKEDDIKYFIIEAVTTDKIVQKADSLGLRKEVFNKNTKDPEIKNRLVYFYNQAEIEDKIPPLTEENLHKFYSDNRTSIFYQLEKINLYAMYFNNAEDANKAYDKIKSGTKFEKVTRDFFVKTYIKERDGELKTYRGNEKPIFAEKAFKMKSKEVSAPVKFVDEDGKTKYAILKCYYIRPEKQLTYDEAKKTILDEEFKNYYKNKLEKEIEDRLAEKYQPKYYYDVLSKLISSNNAK
jgi:parvulin-like peptidyl-prolyl isomerase